MAVLYAALFASAGEPEAVAPKAVAPILLDLAMTASSLGQVDATDAVAAFETYARVYAEAVGVEAIVEATVFASIDELLDSVRRGRQKILGLQITEYLVLMEHDLPLDLEFVSERSGRATETYLILARRDSGLTQLADLRDRALLTCIGQQMGLSQPWLECQLADEGLPPSASFSGSVEIQPRISSALLSVFFGKADACLVAESGFETMAEMNPQLAEQLVVLATSPDVVSFVTCIRSDFTGINRQRTEDAYLGAHAHPQGRQLMTLFGFDRNRRCQAVDIESALAIIRRHERLVRSRADVP